MLAKKAERNGTISVADAVRPLWDTEFGGGIVELQEGGKYILVRAIKDWNVIAVGQILSGSNWKLKPINDLARRHDEKIAGTAKCSCIRQGGKTVPCVHDRGLANVNASKHPNS